MSSVLDRQRAGIGALKTEADLARFIQRELDSRRQVVGAGGPTGIGVLPGARVDRPTSQLIPSGPVTLVSWTEKIFDDGGMIVGALPVDRLFVKTPGKYLCVFQNYFDAHGQYASQGIYRYPAGGGGPEVLAESSNFAGTAAEVNDNGTENVSTIYRFAAGDAIAAYVFQNSGANVNINPGPLAGGYLHLAAQWIGL